MYMKFRIDFILQSAKSDLLSCKKNSPLEYSAFVLIYFAVFGTAKNIFNFRISY